MLLWDEIVLYNLQKCVFSFTKMPPKNYGSAAKRWVVVSYLASPPRSTDAQFMVGQQESCPTTARRHWQCYVTYTTRKRMNQVKSLIGDPAAHLEIAKGSVQANIDYCSKDETSVAGTRFRHGTPPAENTDGLIQNQYESLKEEIKQGCSMQEVAENHFELLVRYGNGVLRAMHYLQRPPMRRNMLNLAIVGQTGKGKSHWICETFGEDVYEKDKSMWWDGYNGERVIHFNDWYGGVEHGVMLNWMDIYRCQVPVKGGYVWLRHSICIFTSNAHPYTWYEKLYESKPTAKAAFVRRLPESNIKIITHAEDFVKFENWNYVTITAPKTDEDDDDGPVPPPAPPASPLGGTVPCTDGGVILVPTVGTQPDTGLTDIRNVLLEDMGDEWMECALDSKELKEKFNYSQEDLDFLKMQGLI